MNLRLDPQPRLRLVQNDYQELLQTGHLKQDFSFPPLFSFQIVLQHGQATRTSNALCQKDRILIEISPEDFKALTEKKSQKSGVQIGAITLQVDLK